MSNPGTTQAVDQRSLSQYDMIIDVRSPGEFAEDHIPGAVNLPVLDNDERAKVGTIYVQESRFLARRVGAAIVARNISRHLEGALADKPADFKPLVYCWRGGQRSNSMATVLAQVGWRTIVLTGGYQTYRRWAQKRLYEEPLGLKLMLLDGGTGCGKTEILKRAAALGVQTVDLEALAKHRGSLFGATGEPQPAQKGFESSLLRLFDGMDRGKPVLLEAESSKVGNRTLPPALWQAMLEAPRIELSAPLAARAAYLVRAYPDVIADRAMLHGVLSKLSVYPGRKRLAAWSEMAEAGQFHELVSEVVERHYDPSYARSSRRDERERLATIEMAAVEEADLDTAARQIAEIIAGVSRRA